MTRYVPAAEINKVFQVHSATLRGSTESGKLDHRRMPGGKRMYNYQQFVKLIGAQCDTPTNKRACIIYARVSSPHQKADLERQTEDLQQAYPDHEVVKDVASGLNWKRPGLLSILERASKGAIEQIVVAYRDRLCRFGLELLEWIFRKFEVRLLVHNKMETTPDPTSELAEDLLAIANYFVAKNNGKRAGEKRQVFGIFNFNFNF
jgi:putative resolvase